MCNTCPLDRLLLSQLNLSGLACAALMQDQARNLQARGIRAQYMSSSQTAAEQAAILKELQARKLSLQLLLTTPESFGTDRQAPFLVQLLWLLSFHWAPANCLGINLCSAPAEYSNSTSQIVAPLAAVHNLRFVVSICSLAVYPESARCCPAGCSVLCGWCMQQAIWGSWL